MLVGCAKVIGMPVASLVDAVTSFFEYFSFLYDFVVFWHGCISRLLARLPTADIHVCLIKNIFVEFIGKFVYNINRRWRYFINIMIRKEWLL